MSPGALGRGCARRGSGESHTLASSLLPRAAPGRGLAVNTPGLGDGLGQGLGAGPPEKRPESFCEVPEATEPLCPETRPRPGITALGAAGLARFPVLGAREGGMLQPISQSSLGEAVPGADRTTDIAWTLKTPSWAPRV